MNIIDFSVIGIISIIISCILIYAYIRVISYRSYEEEMLRYVNKLSKDKQPEPFHGGFIIYANNSRWFLRNYVTWELYWIPESSYKNLDFKKMVTSHSLEFKATWIQEWRKYKLVRRIIYTHPNLECKGFWKIVQFFNFL